MSHEEVIICRSCGTPIQEHIGGLCQTCYEAWKKEQLAKSKEDKETDLSEVLDGIMSRLDSLERQFSEQGLNDLANAIERRIISRMRYGRNPRIEKS